MLRRFDLVIFAYLRGGGISKAITHSFSMFLECLFNNNWETQMIEKGEREIKLDHFREKGFLLMWLLNIEMNAYVMNELNCWKRSNFYLSIERACLNIHGYRYFCKEKHKSAIPIWENLQLANLNSWIQQEQI